MRSDDMPNSRQQVHKMDACKALRPSAPLPRGQNAPKHPQFAAGSFDRILLDAYGNFDIVLDQFSRCSQHYTTTCSGVDQGDLAIHTPRVGDPSTLCPCTLGADRCLPTDVVPDSPTTGRAPGSDSGRDCSRPCRLPTSSRCRGCSASSLRPRWRCSGRAAPWFTRPAPSARSRMRPSSAGRTSS